MINFYVLIGICIVNREENEFQLMVHRFSNESDSLKFWANYSISDLKSRNHVKLDMIFPPLAQIIVNWGNLCERKQYKNMPKATSK